MEAYTDPLKLFFASSCREVLLKNYISAKSGEVEVDVDAASTSASTPPSTTTARRWKKSMATVGTVGLHSTVNPTPAIDRIPLWPTTR